LAFHTFILQKLAALDCIVRIILAMIKNPDLEMAGILPIGIHRHMVIGIPEALDYTIIFIPEIARRSLQIGMAMPAGAVIGELKPVFLSIGCPVKALAVNGQVAITSPVPVIALVTRYSTKLPCGRWQSTH